MKLFLWHPLCEISCRKGKLCVELVTFTSFPRCKRTQAQKLHIQGFSSGRWAKLLLSPAALPDIVIWNKDFSSLKKNKDYFHVTHISLTCTFSSFEQVKMSQFWVLKLPLFDVCGLLFDSFAFVGYFQKHLLQPFHSMCSYHVVFNPMDCSMLLNYLENRSAVLIWLLIGSDPCSLTVIYRLLWGFTAFSVGETLQA